MRDLGLKGPLIEENYMRNSSEYMSERTDSEGLNFGAEWLCRKVAASRDLKGYMQLGGRLSTWSGNVDKDGCEGCWISDFWSHFLFLFMQESINNNIIQWVVEWMIWKYWEIGQAESPVFSKLPAGISLGKLELVMDDPALFNPTQANSATFIDCSETPRLRLTAMIFQVWVVRHANYSQTGRKEFED